MDFNMRQVAENGCPENLQNIEKYLQHKTYLKAQGMKLLNVWITKSLMYSEADKTHGIQVNMKRKLEMQAGANAGNTGGQHDESPHGGGTRPHHIMWPANLLSICSRLYFL